MSEIPALPKDGYWQEHGIAYATAAVARAEYGVHHPSKYIRHRPRKGDGKPHPAIGRFIRYVRRKFLVPPNRVVSVVLLLVADLEEIREATRPAKVAAVVAGTGNLTLAEVTTKLGRDRKSVEQLAAKGLLRTARERRGQVVRQVSRNGRKVTYVQHRHALVFDPEDVDAFGKRPDGMISLPEATARSGIPYETWYGWLKKVFCVPLGKRLRAERQMAPTLDGKRFREMWHIFIKDYNRIVGAKAASGTPTAFTPPHASAGTASRGEADTVETSGTAEPQTGDNPTPRKRGRPTGTVDREVQNNKRLMLEAWDRGEFGMNKTAAGRAFGLDRSTASKIINAHECSKM
jgi:hypothetical protein